MKETTFFELACAHLDSHALMPAEISGAMAAVKADECMANMAERWDKPASDIMEPAQRAILMNVRRIAGVWLRGQNPNHFALGILGE